PSMESHRRDHQPAVAVSETGGTFYRADSSAADSGDLVRMRFVPTTLRGAFIIELERAEDERGFFARTFCQQEFEAHGLNSQITQCSLSLNHKRGTLRGMHYQIAPHQETKIVRCIRGSVFDVIVDLRPGSLTFK